MSKIVQAVNAMISNDSGISEVAKGGYTPSEIFFVYDSKYTWSINKIDDDYYLFYYPNNDKTSALVNLFEDEWDGVPVVKYSTKELGTREAKASFAELYTVVAEKVYGISDVLDDIIDSIIPF